MLRLVVTIFGEGWHWSQLELCSCAPFRQSLKRLLAVQLAETSTDTMGWPVPCVLVWKQVAAYACCRAAPQWGKNKEVCECRKLHEEESSALSMQVHGDTSLSARQQRAMQAKNARAPAPLHKMDKMSGSATLCTCTSSQSAAHKPPACTSPQSPLMGQAMPAW